jgi:hypothetical protein
MECDSNAGLHNVKPFQPAPGRDFVEEAKTIEAKTKGFLLRILSISAPLALSVSGLYGLWYHNYGPLESLWVVIGPILGAMVNHYFGGHRKDSG